MFFEYLSQVASTVSGIVTHYCGRSLSNIIREVLCTRIPYFLIQHTYPDFFWHMRTMLICIRNLFQIKLVVSWFPNINPWGWPLIIVYSPLEILFRPLRIYPLRIFKMDLTFWVFSYVLDIITRYTYFIAKLSDSIYYN